MSLPNIYLIGPMGAGKSTIGRLLAQTLSLRFYDTDKVIELKTGVDVARIFDIEGESGFRMRENQILTELIPLQGIVMATGGGIILNPENRELLSKHGIIVYLKVSFEEQVLRTEKNKYRPLLKNQNLREKLLYLNLERSPLYESIADLTIETDCSSVNVIVDKIANFTKTMSPFHNND